MNLLKKTVSLMLSAVVVTCMGTAVFADSGININQTFKDTNFRTYLKQYDKNSNGYLDDSELKNIKSVDCNSSNKIKDVSGIEKLRYCTSLNVYEGNVVDVDLSKCTNITSVSIINSTTIKSFKAGWDIEYLDISYCSIETLDLSNVFYLKSIRLMCNEKLTGKVDLTRALFLNEVKIASTPVTGISFCKGCRLEFMQIINTNVTSLDLKKVTGMDFTINFVISNNKELRSMLLPGDVFIFHTSHMKNGKTSYSNAGQVFIIE